MGYVVTAALVGVNGADGKIKYLYSGTPVPADVSAADCKRLAADGLIADTTPKVAEPEIPEGDPSKDWTVKQLVAFADRENIDLGDATKKDDILAAIEDSE